MDNKKLMTAKEFDIKFWQDNDLFETPIWKELRAYHEYKVANSSNVIHDVSKSLPSFDNIDEMAKKKCSVEKIHERRAFCDGAEWMKSHVEENER